LGWPRADAWGHVGLPGPDGAAAEDLSVVRVGASGHREGRMLAIHADRARARLGPGCPPRWCQV
jgi:hypothetical protein